MLVAPGATLIPPASKTVPLGSKVAVAERCAVFIELVAVQIPRDGSNNSAAARLLRLLSRPPAMSTFPLGSSVAVWLWRFVVMGAISVHVPLSGSYSSALGRAATAPLEETPPAVRPSPFGS